MQNRKLVILSILSLKWQKKRAIVDAVLSATRSSSLFTQDIEDFPDSNASTKALQKKDNLNYQNAGSDQPNVKTATLNQLNLIVKLVSDKQISTEATKALIHQRYNVQESKLLSTQQADDFIKFLKTYKVES